MIPVDRKLDAEQLGNLLNAKYGLERNISGKMLDGVLFKNAAPLRNRTRKSRENKGVDNLEPD